MKEYKTTEHQGFTETAANTAAETATKDTVATTEIAQPSTAPQPTETPQPAEAPILTTETPQTPAPLTAPAVMMKRIGSTTYRVTIYFSETSKETMNDKIIRLIKNEAAYGKAAG